MNDKKRKIKLELFFGIYNITNHETRQGQKTSKAGQESCTS
jgi:hypothetical protein